MTVIRGVRPCAVCGQFYSADADELRRDIKALLEKVERKSVGGRIHGIISPHAGYMYSGFTAANGFALLQGSTYSSVVIVSPSHREYFDGISVFPGDGYETPLGEVTLNSPLREQLLSECSLVQASPAGHGEEHAVEVELPFLQEVLPEFSFLPIVIGDQKREYCFELGKALASILKDKNALLVASTDLSHYHSSKIANELDSVMIEDVRIFDYERLMSDLEKGKTEACGGGPTVAVMAALSHLGVDKMEILHHCNSGDITGDNNSVVGYLSAVAHE
ncbi:MAG: AmmeMemoRadiSam system protein B [Ignavibacteria bacterium]|nr:AmmeMemoRadiSam system protein B [Ignavibacteria bacterium]